MKDFLAGFEDTARARVKSVLEEAEKKTSAEIMPVVAVSSGRYERAEDIVGLWCALFLFTLVWVFFQGVVSDDGSWVGRPGLRLGYWPLAAVLIVGFFTGVIAAGRLAWLRRLFVPRRDMERDVTSRAKGVFFDRRVHRTEGAQGVLLYVSLFERMVAVLVDDTIAEQLSERALEEVRDQVVGGLRKEGLAGGLEKGIERLGDLLGGVLPAAEGDVNYLPNEVVVLE